MLGSHRRLERAFDLRSELQLDETGNEGSGKIRNWRRHIFVREEVVSLDFGLPTSSMPSSAAAEADAALLRPLGGWGTECMLLPGGEYILVRWPAGYLQCFSTASASTSMAAKSTIGSGLVWTYPPLPTREQMNAGVVQPLIVSSFSADMVRTELGKLEIRILVVSDVSGEEPDARFVLVLIWFAAAELTGSRAFFAG